MASEPKRLSKTEVLSMRMDPKTRFLVDFIAKARGQSITTVVERAILEAADNTHVAGKDKTWRDFWSLSEGVRSLRIANEQGLFPSYEDEFRLNFARTHWPFFYSGADLKTLRVAYIDILWPRIDEFMEIWERTQAKDYFRAGQTMALVLREAGLAPPDWPIKSPRPKADPPTPPPKSENSDPSWEPTGGDLDDEIPF